MAGAVVLLGTFFAVESVRQMHELQAFIRDPVPIHWEAVPAAGLPPQFRVRAALEVHAMEQRERLATLALASRSWTRYMAFITGMVLAVIGATFVLGRLEEQVTRVDGGGAGLRVAVESASPGLVLAALGTVLMLTGVLTGLDVRATDEPVYVGAVAPTVPADEVTDSAGGASRSDVAGPPAVDATDATKRPRTARDSAILGALRGGAVGTSRAGDRVEGGPSPAGAHHPGASVTAP